jgi:HD-GYP domain-containing protein (c-di-GMP phosphodiesterase class II)
MLKRIGVQELQVGMYIHELGSAWLDHPFWRSSFKIENDRDLERIRTSGIHEAWIDTERGLDTPGGVTQAELEAEVERDLLDTAAEPVRPCRIVAEEEIGRAVKISAASCEAITALFQEARMGRAIQAETVMPVVDEIADSVLRNPSVLTALNRLRRQDNYTYLHSISVCALMVALGNQIGLEIGQCREAGLAGLLHDIGKVHIDLDLLNKKERLSDGEIAQLRRHATMGHELLAQDDSASAVVLDVCLHHHERLDGSGYPEGLSGEGISLFARMAAVSDVYDATTSNRPYKDAWQPALALRKMTEWSGCGYFDRRVFHAFVRTVGIYPIGTLVRLKSNKLAVVIDQSADSLLRPRVKIFFSITADRRLPPQMVDLSRPGSNDEIVSHEDPAAWGIDDLDFLWSGVDRRHS